MHRVDSLSKAQFMGQATRVDGCVLRHPLSEMDQLHS